jgi:hypothetical protein
LEPGRARPGVGRGHDAQATRPERVERDAHDIERIAILEFNDLTCVVHGDTNDPV